MSKRAKLKAPYPYFGGKSAVATLIWERIGDVDNYIEPFCGSAAVLLGRPHPPRIETVNDADCMVANFWRATKEAPEAVAEFADWPVNEADLHSRHRWLVLSEEAAEFRRRMRVEPDYFDAKVAGWWCWGLCAWIGGGWCATPKSEAVPLLRGMYGMTGAGVNMEGGRGSGPPLSPGRKPRIDGGEGQYGHGVHAKGEPAEKRPRLHGGQGADPPGVHSGMAELHQKRPRCHSEHGSGTGGSLPGVTGRPQLADAYSRGRGVNGNDAAGTCDQRRAWLVEWFGRLRDRLRTVRVCCGDWLRVCDSDSVTTRLGVTGIFFDPPYSSEAGRDMKLYATDCGKVAHDVRAYCLERGGNPKYRIALCGYEGEGHEALEAAGWDVVKWASQGGYGNRSVKGKANAKRESIWFSPHCTAAPSLFAAPGAAGG